MQPIPTKLRKELAESGQINVCIHNNSECQGRVEWEHCWSYGKHQIQELWAIVPCCYKHHRGGLLDKDFNRYCSLLKAISLSDNGLIDIIIKYPRKNWKQEWEYLYSKFNNYDKNITS